MTEQEKNQLIEEAKQRFPIGCKFINTVGEEYVLQSDNYTYRISANNSVWAQSGAGCLYQNGKWAEVISKPESNKLSEPKYDYEAVHCTTQEEWDFVLDKLSHLNNNIQKNYDWKRYNSKSCLNIKTLSKADKDWYLRNNGLIYSFQEWCDKFGHKPDFKPKFEVGKWYKINNCWYAKFNMIHGQNTYWQYTESITFQGVYNKLSDNIKMSSIKDGLSVVLLTDLSEIQQYLPDNHPDKIKVMKEESLVGRYLKALVDEPQSTMYKKGNYVKIIKKIRDNKYTLEQNWTYTTDNLTANQWQLMPIDFTPDNIIPEYVEFIVDYNQAKKGDILKVVNYKLGSFQFFNGDYFCCSQYETSRYFKPSTKEAFEAQSKSTDTNWIPKIGEWVIFLGGYSDLKLNQAYQIQEHQFEDYYYLKGTGLALKKDKHFRKALPHEIPNNEIVLTPETYGYLSNRYFISVGAEEHSITPKQAVKSIFDKDYSSPLNEVLELPKSSKKKTKQLIY